MLKVIVTDRDTTLMNVVATIFPKTIALLCHFYVGKNARAKCITNFTFGLNYLLAYAKQLIQINKLLFILFINLSRCSLWKNNL